MEWHMLIDSMSSHDLIIAEFGIPMNVRDSELCESLAANAFENGYRFIATDPTAGSIDRIIRPFDHEIRSSKPGIFHFSHPARL
jgi:hypothetical protein